MVCDNALLSHHTTFNFMEERQAMRDILPVIRSKTAQPDAWETLVWSLSGMEGF